MFIKPVSLIAKCARLFRDPVECSLLGSSVSGIFQARLLEWVAISFSNFFFWNITTKSENNIYIYCFYFSNWWVIALKCSVGSRCTTKQISHNYIYIIPLKSYSHIYWSSQSAGLGSLCYITAFHWKIKTRIHVHFFPFLILVFTFSVFGNFKLNIYTFKVNSYLLINQSRQSILM